MTLSHIKFNYRITTVLQLPTKGQRDQRNIFHYFISENRSKIRNINKYDVFIK